MKLKNILTIDAIVIALFGLTFTFAPGLGYGMFGIDVDAAAADMIRTSGIIMIGVALATWIGRDSAPSTARKGLIIGLVVMFVGVAINDTIDTLRGVLNAMGWGTVVLTAVLAVLTALARRSAQS